MTAPLAIPVIRHPDFTDRDRVEVEVDGGVLADRLRLWDQSRSGRGYGQTAQQRSGYGFAAGLPYGEGLYGAGYYGQGAELILLDTATRFASAYYAVRLRVVSEQGNAGPWSEPIDAPQSLQSGINSDTIDIELRRDSQELVLGVKTRDQEAQAFTFFGDGANLDFDFRADAPMVWFGPARPWGDMELVELSPGLGRYFGTDSGLLVVRAPSDPALKLEDGDVIRRIGGREPGSVSHAIRILRSYEEGEELELEIMREKRSRKLAVQIPASQGALAPLPHLPSLPVIRPPAAAPERAPAAPPKADFGLPEV